MIQRSQLKRSRSSTNSRKMTQNPQGQEEVLQTKIISPKEVARDRETWLEAVDAEVDSPTHEKEALKKLTPEEHQEIKRKAEEEGRTIPPNEGSLHREAQSRSFQTQSALGGAPKPGTEDGRRTELQRRCRRHCTKSAHLGISKIWMEGIRFGYACVEQDPDEDVFLLRPPSSPKNVFWIEARCTSH